MRKLSSHTRLQMARTSVSAALESEETSPGVREALLRAALGRCGAGGVHILPLRGLCFSAGSFLAFGFIRLCYRETEGLLLNLVTLISCEKLQSDDVFAKSMLESSGCWFALSVLKMDKCCAWRETIRCSSGSVCACLMVLWAVTLLKRPLRMCAWQTRVGFTFCLCSLLSGKPGMML